MLTDDGSARVAQQLIVVQQASGNGILYGEHTYHRRIILHVGEDILEGGTADQLYLFTLEKQMCRDIVKRSYQSLYCYSLHILFILYILNENPTFTM